MSGAPADYVDVATRIAEFRAAHPEGSLQQVDVKFLDFAGKCWVVYTAAAYRTPDDPRPGHGTAWEPVPGPTNFTRDSELQNAETSAWGRALIAVLAADSKRGVASADEVRNRNAPPDPVDTTEVEAALHDAKVARVAAEHRDARKIMPYARESQSNADQAARVLRKRIAEMSEGSGPDGDGEAAPGPDESWEAAYGDLGIQPERLLIELQTMWPKNDAPSRPTRTKDLDAAYARHPDVFAQAVDNLTPEADDDVR